VTNDSIAVVDCRVEWKLRTNSSEVLQEGTVTATIAKLSAQKLECLDFSDILTEEMKRNTYLECQLFVNSEWISSSSILFTKSKHFKFLNPMLAAEVEETAATFEISVRSKSFAKYIELELSKADCKFSDNYFDLSVGDVRRIIVNKESLSESLDLQTFLLQLKIRSIYDMA
jgi:beta-mannosidase